MERCDQFHLSDFRRRFGPLLGFQLHWCPKKSIRAKGRSARSSARPAPADLSLFTPERRRTKVETGTLRPGSHRARTQIHRVDRQLAYSCEARGRIGAHVRHACRSDLPQALRPSPGITDMAGGPTGVPEGHRSFLPADQADDAYRDLIASPSSTVGYLPSAAARVSGAACAIEVDPVHATEELGTPGRANRADRAVRPQG